MSGHALDGQLRTADSEQPQPIAKHIAHDRTGRPLPPVCSSPIPNAKWSATFGISGNSPISGYVPPDYEACVARCRSTVGCAKFTFLARPSSIGNMCYLYFAGASAIATLPSSFSTFYAGNSECTVAKASQNDRCCRMAVPDPEMMPACWMDVVRWLAG